MAIATKEPEVIKALDHKVMIGFYENDDYYYYRNTLVFCSCGHTTSIRAHNSNTSTTCPNCGLMKVKRINRPTRATNTVVDGMLECIEKDDKSFRLAKTEVIASVKVEGEGIYNVKFVKGKTYELYYSLRTKTLQVFKDGKELSNNDDNIDLFFRGQMDIRTFLNTITTDNNREMFILAIDHLGKEGYERTKKIGRALRRLFNYPAVELLNSCGFKDLNYLFETSYGKSRATKPNEVMGVSKMAFNMLKDMDKINYLTHENIKTLESSLDGNTIKEVLQIMKEEANVSDFINNADLVTTLKNDYGYKDIKKLMLYACRHVKLEQGIMRPQSALTTLRDYARMCKEMNVEWDKYSKSLKKDHDIAMMNYNINKDEIMAKKFLKVVEQEDYSNLAYKPSKDKFVIVVPQSSSEIIQEGSSLSHCVASYVKDIIDLKCKILFLRHKETPDVSLVTVEIRDNNIRQARGFGNRDLNEEELEFLRKWAEKKELNVVCY